jgi:hypothetical protein
VGRKLLRVGHELERAAAAVSTATKSKGAEWSRNSNVKVILEVLQGNTIGPSFMTLLSLQSDARTYVRLPTW